MFRCDAIFNIKHKSNWKFIHERKQKLIDENNNKENSRPIPHSYHIGDKVLYHAEPLAKFGINAYKGPNNVVKVNNNGTVHMRKGALTDTVNIRNIHPYHE